MLLNKENLRKSTLALLTTLLLLSAFNATWTSVNAQGQAIINLYDSVGGTTDPSAGTFTKADGSTLTLTATPREGFLFDAWLVTSNTGNPFTSTDNPLSFGVMGGTTYNIQATFTALQPAGDVGFTVPVNYTDLLATSAIDIILSAVGGTTNPKPGTYILANTSTVSMTAIPDSGWTFSHWIISGTNMNHGGYPFTPTPTNNPYTLDHTYGYTYSYQPVFTPTGGASPSPTPTASNAGGLIAGFTQEVLIIFGLFVIIIVLLIAIGVLALRRRK